MDTLLSAVADLKRDDISARFALWRRSGVLTVESYIIRWPLYVEQDIELLIPHLPPDHFFLLGAARCQGLSWYVRRGAIRRLPEGHPIRVEIARADREWLLRGEAVSGLPADHAVRVEIARADKNREIWEVRLQAVMGLPAGHPARVEIARSDKSLCVRQGAVVSLSSDHTARVELDTPTPLAEGAREIFPIEPMLKYASEWDKAFHERASKWADSGDLTVLAYVLLWPLYAAADFRAFLHSDGPLHKRHPFRIALATEAPWQSIRQEASNSLAARLPVWEHIAKYEEDDQMRKTATYNVDVETLESMALQDKSSRVRFVARTCLPTGHPLYLDYRKVVY